LKIRDIVQELINNFQSNQVNEDSEDERMARFFVLDFIKVDYGLEVMEFEKGEKIEEKLQSTSLSLQLEEELHQICFFLREIENTCRCYDGDKLNEYGEKLLIMYNFLHLLISKKQHLFSQSGIGYYCQTYKLHRMKVQNEKDGDYILHTNIHECCDMSQSLT
jgi:hypothetical protein